MNMLEEMKGKRSGQATLGPQRVVGGCFFASKPAVLRVVHLDGGEHLGGLAAYLLDYRLEHGGVGLHSRAQLVELGVEAELPQGGRIGRRRLGDGLNAGGQQLEPAHAAVRRAPEHAGLVLVAVLLLGVVLHVRHACAPQHQESNERQLLQAAL